MLMIGISLLLLSYLFLEAIMHYLKGL